MKGKLKKIDKDKLPVYQIVVEDGDDTGISLISLVDAPAIEMKGMMFSKNQVMSFKEVGDKQVIVGPALIPNMKIYREDEKYGQYYVVFTEDTIAKMVEKFNKYGSNRKINIDHSNQMVDAFIMEDWIVEDSVYDKSRKYGIEVPIGTYMIMVKIEDTDFWNTEVKGNEKFGFSIEGLLGQQLVTLLKQEEANIDDLELDDLLEIFELKKWKIKDVNPGNGESSNVDRIMYNDETFELVIKFQDGSTYTYSNVDFNLFKDVWQGRASCVTDDPTGQDRWWYGKSPSVGAAVYKKLVVAGVPYTRGGSVY
jgi:hypothetical protein